MALSIRIDPPIPDAEEILEKAFRSRSLVLVVGTCRVNYQGRASSTLGWGERIVIVKQDGSVLVHRPVGYEPVNWQPPKCVIKVRVDSPGTLTVSASRHQPSETVAMEFERIMLVATGSLKDIGEFALHVTEEQMKQAILSAPELVEQGLKLLEEEKGLETGFTDICAQDKDGNLVVVEIKRNQATKETVMQLERYLETMRKHAGRPVRGIVVAPKLRKSAQPILNSLGLEYVRLDPEKCFDVLKSRKDMKLSHFFT